ncbi:unnamed protein product, partial [Iphiclides podalirius]
MLQRLFITILCAVNFQHRQRCTLNTRIHFGEPLPVIIRDGRLLEPTDRDGNIRLEHGDSLILSCLDRGNIRHSNAIKGLDTASISCVDGDMFENSEWLIAPSYFREFSCGYPPSYISVRTNRTCFSRNWIYEVGYRVQDVFHPVYESCFDESQLNAVYSTYTQKPYNALYQTRVDRPFFIDNNVYGNVPVNSLFSPPGQKGAVARLVGARVDVYVNNTEFLSRGHLAAKTDFPLAFGERATFHYVNCAPQWVGFNGGNWNTLEVDLRNHIHAIGWDTVVYTGTYGVSELADQHGRSVGIYLHSDVNNNPVIPVPKYFYKVVYEPSTKRGIAFVGINNPHCTAKEARSLFFCRDLCRDNRNFNWLSWHPDKSSEGYAFCCTVEQFRETVRHLPNFEVNDLLM